MSGLAKRLARHGLDAGDASPRGVPDVDYSVLGASVLIPGLHGGTDRAVALPRLLPRTRLLPDLTADGFCPESAQPITQ